MPAKPPRHPEFSNTQMSHLINKYVGQARPWPDKSAWTTPMIMLDPVTCTDGLCHGKMMLRHHLGGCATQGRVMSEPVICADMRRLAFEALSGFDEECHSLPYRSYLRQDKRRYPAEIFRPRFCPPCPETVPWYLPPAASWPGRPSPCDRGRTWPPPAFLIIPSRSGRSCCRASPAPSGTRQGR